VAQEDIERQLKIWKELAISKQLLIRAATDALGLDPDCEADVLQNKLSEAIKHSMEADASIEHAREQARIAVEVMEKKIADSDKATEKAHEAEKTAKKAMEKLRQSMDAMRSANAEEAKKAKAIIAEKDKALKAINKALADTPENVVKKLNALKKQKTDAAKAQKQAEATTRSAYKEKQQTQKKLNSVQNEAKALTTRFRELHQICIDIQKQLKPLAKDADGIPEIPELDEKLLKKFEKTESKD